MDPWTIKKLLGWSSDYFDHKGLESARLDSEILLAFILGLRRLDLYLQFDRPVSQDELVAYKKLIQRRLDHEPVAYIVGKKEFWSREFFVTPDVLIPRPDTETLIEVVLDHYKNNRNQLKACEVGVGSGAIAITLLDELKTLTMSAVEISRQAMAVAQKNAAYHGVLDRLSLGEADFLTMHQDDGLKLFQQEQKFDFICSNPPYVKTKELKLLPRSVVDYEPGQALVGGDDGLIFYPALIQFAKKYLKTDGLLVVEIGEDQGRAVFDLFKGGGLQQVRLKKDFSGLDRVVYGTWGG